MVAQFKVGSFTMAGTTGNQSVTGVGFQPKAIMFWTSNPNAEPSGTWVSHVYQTIGFTSGPTESYSVAGASQSAGGISSTRRRIASKCMTLLDYNATSPLREADLVSFDADGFTINWTTATAFGTRPLNYLAIGGAGVSAKVVNWTSPTATGNKAVTGVGFTPDVVLHAPSTLTSVPQSATTMLIGSGAMDSSGGQWANAVGSIDGLSTSDTGRYQRTDKCLAVLNSTSNLPLLEQASFVSMDSDGFTTNFDTVSGSARQNISLCLSGVNAKVGSFQTGNAASSTITGVGFEPAAIMTTSIGDPTTTVSATGCFSLGAATSATERRASFQFDMDALDTTDAQSAWNNDLITGQGLATYPYLWTADLTSMDSDGFTIDYPLQDTGNDYIHYLALADGNTAPNAPTLVHPTAGERISAIQNTTFDWTFSDPDAGDTQSQYALRRKVVP